MIDGIENETRNPVNNTLSRSGFLSGFLFLFPLFFLFVAFTQLTFISDIQSSRLITNPPTSLGSLLISYNTILSSLLDKHAPIISKLSKRRTKPNPRFTSTLHAFRSKVRHAETVYKHTHSAQSCTNTLILLSLGYLSSLSETTTTT